MQSNKRLRTESVDLLSTLDKLRSFILGNTLDAGNLPNQILECIPTVIVLGDQSSGKSSLLSAISKHDLPVGTGRTTASRIELRFRKSPIEKSTIKYENNDGSIHSEQALTKDNINHAHDFLIQHALQTSGNNEFYVDGAIVLNIEGPDEKNMTLVDLPGLIVPTDAESTSRSAAINSMINKYIDKPNCLVIHVLDVSKDVDITLSRSQITKYKLPTERVINVFTKFDMLNENYHQAKLNEIWTKVKQGIFVQCRDVQGKTVELENFTDRDSRFIYGREHLLVKVEKFTQDYIQLKQSRLLSLLRMFQSTIGDTLRRLGYRVKQGHEIYHTYSVELFKKLQEIKSDEKHFAQLVERVHGVAPLAIAVPLDNQTILRQLITERGLRLCSPVEVIIRSYIRQSVESIQNEVNAWEADFTQALRDDISKSINLEGFPSACKHIDDHIENQSMEYITTIMKSLIDDNQTYLNESHTSPSLFDRQEFDSYVNQNTSSLNILRKIVNDINGGIPSNHITAYVQREIQNIENRAGEVDVIKSQIQAYWKSRMHIFQNMLHDKLTTIRNKVFENLGQSIREFKNIEQLSEDTNDVHFRETYIQADILVSECISALH